MKTFNLLWKHSLPLIKYLFSRNSYVCPIWIFIFDTEEEQINSADGFSTVLHTLHCNEGPVRIQYIYGSHLCISRNETVQPTYFQNRIIMICLPIPTLIYLWEIYIFPGMVCLFCCSQIYRPILGIYKSLTDTGMWKLELRPRNSQKRNT